MPLISINPATGRRIRRYRPHTARQVEAALVRAQRAFPAWRSLTVTQRIRHLRAVSAVLRHRQNMLADLLTAEVGKPLAQSRAEVAKCALACNYYIRHGADFLRPQRPVEAAPNSRVVYEPLGCILAIMPWNFPYWQLFRAAAPALIAGNTMLLKHSSNVSGCALAIEDVFREAGLPPGVFQTLLIGAAPAAKLIQDDRIRGVTLTGSTSAGRIVAAAAGAALKPAVFELGGSDPYLILADADLDQAAEVCAEARLTNSGQSCVGAKRFIVVNKVRRAFEHKFVARMARRTVGDPADPATAVGPMARRDLRDELHHQVTRSVRLGARILLGGRPLPGAGWFYAPTVLSGVKPGMPAYTEELFGPVAAVIGVRDEAEAIRVANDTPYGLGAAIFSRNRARARRLAAQIEAGLVFINAAVHSDPALPFGGVKQSGFGRELAQAGIRSFVNIKTMKAW